MKQKPISAKIDPHLYVLLRHLQQTQGLKINKAINEALRPYLRDQYNISDYYLYGRSRCQDMEAYWRLIPE